MISAELISDPEYNSLSLEAQNIFIRMLSISDDCGVVPANTYRLNTLINTPPKQKEKIQQYVDEIVSVGLGNRFTYRNENYFSFKAKSFEDYQSYILKKATKSEYLRIPKEDFQELSKNFQELPRISFQDEQSAVSTVESKKQKVESIKQRAESGRLEIIPSHDTDGFKVAFFNFTRHRKELKKPLTPMAEQATLKKLYKHDVETAIKMIEESISNGWQGIFELKGNSNGTNGNTGKKSDATTRATFKHSEQQIKDLRDFEESLRQRYPERS